MADPRNLVQRILYATWPSFREGMNRKWQYNHGTPPPWTAAGKKYAQAQEVIARQLETPPPVHGDARWMSRAEAAAIVGDVTAEPKPHGVDFLSLGYAVDLDMREAHCEALSTAPGHVLTIAATRAGKGASQIVPNLLVYGGSMLIIDPKGENYAMTHQQRRKLGMVFRLDPFRVTEKWDNEAAFSQYNPLEAIREPADARRLADMLMGEAPNGEGLFWHNEALNFLTGIILFVSQLKHHNTLSTVREIVTLPDGPDTDKAPSKLLQRVRQMMELSNDPVVKRAMSVFSGQPPKMRSGVVSTINAKTAIWDEQPMSEAVGGHHLDLEQLKHTRITVYVILPLDKLHTYGAFLRLMVAQFYQAMVRDEKTPDVPVVCLVDEFPALGAMDEIVRALAEVAGFGVRFWIFVQSVAQLSSTYPKTWQQVLSQCSTKSVFGVTDGETAKWLSEELSNTTVAYLSSSTSVGGGTLDASMHATGNAGTGLSVQLAGKPLLTVPEIREHLGVGRRFAVTFLSGHAPMMTLLAPWYEDGFLSALGTDLTVPTVKTVAAAGVTPAKPVFDDNYTFGIREADKDD